MTLFNNKYYSGPKSDHFNGSRFHNLCPSKPRGLKDLLKWRLTSKPQFWPQSVKNEFNDIPPSRVEGDHLRVSWVGHVTFLLQTQNINILTDPVWSQRVSPFKWLGPKRVHAPGIEWANLPKIDIILISHNHYDHLDLETIKTIWDRDRPRIIVPLGNDTIIKNFDPQIEVEAYDWHGTVKINPNISIGVEPIHHWSARGIFDANHALWAAFVIQTAGGNIYFVGDSAYAKGTNFQNTLNKYKSFRLALLPIGAYAPRWFMRDAHMDPQEAILAFKDLNQPYAIPSHYATFPLADDGYNETLLEFIKQRTDHAVDPAVFKPLKVGEHWFIPRLNS